MMGSPSSKYDQLINAIQSSQLNALLGPDAAELVTYTAPQAGAVATNVAVKLAQMPSVFDFLTAAQQAAVSLRTGAIDVTTGLLAAAAASVPLAFPAGMYPTSTSLAFTNSLIAFDAKNTVISCTDLTVPTATVQGTNIDVQNITFTHPSAPASGSGANGLNVLAGSYQINVNSCVANFNDKGIVVFAGSSALWLTENNCSNNASSGFLLQNPNYLVQGNISTTNGGFGYEMTTVGAQGAGLQLSYNLSYNNIGGGYSFVGSGSSGGATSLDDVLASNNISSFDQGNGWFFDTHGINLLLSNNYTEYCGYNPFGSIVNNNAVGYSFTVNNSAATMSNNIAYHCTSDGVFNAGDLTVVGGALYNNGLGASGGYGIQGTNTGFTSVTGTTFSANVTGAQNTIAGFAAFYNCPGLNQAVFLTAPAFAGTGVGVLNPFNIPVTVYLTSVVVTSVQIKMAGTTSAAITSTSGSSFNLPPGAIIIPTYTGSPSWVWIPA